MRLSLNSAPFAAAIDDGWLVGPWRAPPNIALDAVGTIHDDATARALGLRGGTVAGSIHMEQCTPLLELHFGDRWYQRGCLSLYFRNATQNEEAVQVRLRNSAGATEIELRMRDGSLVAEGTASLQDFGNSALRQRLARAGHAKDLRIFAGIRIGDTAERREVKITYSQLTAHLGSITERNHRYAANGMLPYNLAIDLMRSAEPELAPLPIGVVGLYGGIEVQATTGPLFADQIYTVSAHVVGLGETPQTEVLWQEAEAIDASGSTVCKMLMMSRVMKSSSPLWRNA